MEKNRHSGRTTRLCNDYIEIMFSNRGEWYEIFDHYDMGNNKHANKCLHEKILKRMSFENPHNKIEYTETKIRIL